MSSKLKEEDQDEFVDYLVSEHKWKRLGSDGLNTYNLGIPEVFEDRSSSKIKRKKHKRGKHYFPLNLSFVTDANYMYHTLFKPYIVEFNQKKIKKVWEETYRKKQVNDLAKRERLSSEALVKMSENVQEQHITPVRASSGKRKAVNDDDNEDDNREAQYATENEESEETVTSITTSKKKKKGRPPKYQRSNDGGVLDLNVSAAEFNKVDELHVEFKELYDGYKDFEKKLAALNDKITYLQEGDIASLVIEAVELLERQRSKNFKPEMKESILQRLIRLRDKILRWYEGRQAKLVCIVSKFPPEVFPFDKIAKEYEEAEGWSPQLMFLFGAYYVAYKNLKLE